MQEDLGSWQEHLEAVHSSDHADENDSYGNGNSLQDKMSMEDSPSSPDWQRYAPNPSTPFPS